MKWDACILLLALGKMPYVFPSVDEFEVSRTSLSSVLNFSFELFPVQKLSSAQPT